MRGAIGGSRDGVHPVDVLRLGLASTLVLLLVAACGGSPRAAAPKLPGRLAQSWAVRADRIAAAANQGNDCRAQRLAGSLSAEVSLKEDKIPVRLRAPLLEGVQTLADSITCVPLRHKPPPKKPGPKPPKPPKDHGHDKHGGEG
jgi:hypothetical protein